MRHVRHCRVCYSDTACKVQGSNFYRTEGYKYFKAAKAKFDYCCPGCKSVYQADVKRYASIAVLLSYRQITRKEWELQGCE